MTKKIIDIYDQIPLGKDYRPAITIQDISSLGRSHRIYNIKIGRQQDFLSDRERDYFYILYFSDSVVDIREQFPLHLDTTLLIAKEVGIPHSIHPKTKKPVHLTSDFVITVNIDGKFKNIVRTIKGKDELTDRRVIEKFDIEYRYWQGLGLDWGIVTDKEINKTLALNIADIMSYYILNNRDGFEKIHDDELNDIIVAFAERLIDSNKTIREASSIFEQDLHLKKGCGISLFKHILARKYLKIDMLQPLNLDNIIKVELTQKIIDIGRAI